MAVRALCRALAVARGLSFGFRLELAIFGPGIGGGTRRERLEISFRFNRLSGSRMGARVVDGTGLENRQGLTLLVGSNPTPSANNPGGPEAGFRGYWVIGGAVD